MGLRILDSGGLHLLECFFMIAYDIWLDRNMVVQSEANRDAQWICNGAINQLESFEKARVLMPSIPSGLVSYWVPPPILKLNLS